MANKQSYADIVTNPHTDNQPQQEFENGGSPSDAPPPYDGPHTKPPPPSDAAIQQQRQVDGSNFHQHLGSAEQGAVVPGQWSQPPDNVVKARAMRRFWGAFFWAWVIWIVIGMIVGGGISDVENNPPNRNGHWDKHGNWRNDGVQINLAQPNAVMEGGARTSTIEILPQF